MATHDLIVKFSANMGDFKKQLSQIKTATKNAFDGMENSSKKAMQGLENSIKKGFNDSEKTVKKSGEDMKKSMQKSLNSMEKETKKMSSTIKSTLKGLAAYFSIDATINFAVEGMEAAGELNAMRAQYKQIWSGITKDADKEIQRLEKKTGAVGNRLRPTLSEWGVRYQGLGMDAKTALQMAGKATEMAADAAAMYDMELETANTHMSSFINGNYEGGRAIGLFANDTQMAQFAVKQGIIGDTKEWRKLDEATRQATRSEYAENIQKQGKVVGQAEREADQYVNVVGNLKRSWQDFKAELVNSTFFDIAVVGMRKVSEALQKVNWDKVSEKVKTFVTIFKEKFTEISNVLSPIANGIKWLLEGIWDNLGGGQGVLDTAKGAWDLFIQALETAMDILEPIGEAIKTLIDKTSDLYEKLSGGETPIETFRSCMDGARKVLKLVEDNTRDCTDALIILGATIAAFKIVSWITALGKVGIVLKLGATLAKVAALFSKIGAIVAKVVGFLLGNWVALLIAAIVGLVLVVIKNWDKIVAWFKNKFPNAYKWISDTWEKVKKACLTAWNFIKDKVINVALGIWSELKPVFDGMSKNLSKIFGEIKDICVSAWKYIKAEVIPILVDIWNFLKPILMAIWSVFSTVFKAIATVTKWVCGVIWGAIKAAFALVYGIVKTVFVAAWVLVKSTILVAWNFLKPFLAFLAKSFVAAFKIVWNIVKWCFEGIWSVIKKLWNWIVPPLQRVWNFLVEQTKTHMKSFKENLINPIKDGWNWIKEKFGEFKKWALGLPKELGDGMKKGGKTFANGFISIFNLAIEWAVKGINKLLDAVEWCLEKVGVDKSWNIDSGDYTISYLAKGTNDWQGGMAIVGERGRELVSDPNLGTFMADSATLLPLSKGAVVLKNSRTERLLKGMGVPGFAGGIGRFSSVNKDTVKKQTGKGGKIVKKGAEKAIKKAKEVAKSVWDTIGNVWDYITDPAALVEKIFEKLGLDSTDGNFFSEVIKTWIFDTLPSKVTEYVKGIFESDEVKNNPDNPMNGTGSKAVDDWIPTIKKAANFFGETLSGNELKRILQQIRTESGGNAGAIQSMAVKDVNSARGMAFLARGLLQYVPTTFASYKVSGYEDIFNGYHQLLAFFNNSQWRKNLPALGEKRGWSPRGKRRKAANGFLATTETDLTVGEAGMEAVVPLSNAHALKPFGLAVANSLLSGTPAEPVIENPTYTFTIPVTVDGREVARATATFTKEELDKLEHRQSRRQGKK